MILEPAAAFLSSSTIPDYSGLLVEALHGMLSPPWQCQCGAENSDCRGAGSSYLAESVMLLWELCPKSHPSVCFSSPACASVSSYKACNPSLSTLNQLERRLVTEP